MKRGGLRRKLVRVFLLQIVLISLATLTGIYAAGQIVEQVMIREALESEAQHYWELYKQSQIAPHRPNTQNLTGYLAIDGDTSEVPEALRMLGSGRYHGFVLGNQAPTIHVSEHANAKLYLVFDEGQVARLALFFGIVPLSGVLLTLYLLSWIGYRQSQRAVSPIVQLAERFEHLEFRQQNLAMPDLEDIRKAADTDALALVEALEHFTHRLSTFVERERQFTRDASHELRTPLAVIKNSLDLLQKRDYHTDKDTAALERIRRTVQDMESLIETLLLLARESEQLLAKEPIILNDLVNQNVDSTFRTIAHRKGVGINIIENCLVEVSASERVLSILLNNLLSNAFNYTAQGEVTITIDDKRLSVQDTGRGMSHEQLAQAFEPFYRGEQPKGQGHGLGLAIVKRLCHSFDWAVQARSVPGEGATITLIFPEARRLGVKVCKNTG